MFQWIPPHPFTLLAVPALIARYCIETVLTLAFPLAVLGRASSWSDSSNFRSLDKNFMFSLFRPVLPKLLVAPSELIVGLILE